LTDYQAAEVVVDGGDEHQDHEPGDEPPVKDVAHDRDECILYIETLPPEGKEKVHQEEKRQKIEYKDMRRKNHSLQPSP
jgi:hypothetical protein